MEKQRRIDLDALRIIACFLVIFNHLPGYALYMSADTAWKTWVYMIPTMITRINVPLFFMISGTLLLTDRPETYRHIFRKRILRIFCALLAATLALYLIRIYRAQVPFDGMQYVRYLLGESADIGGRAYWYLYCYLGFLLFLPFFRRIAKGMTRADFILLLVIHFLFNSFLPVLNLILTSKGIAAIDVSAHFTGTIRFALAKVMFYPLIGYYIDRHINIMEMKPSRLLLLFFFTCIGILASSACTFYEGTHGDLVFTQNYVELSDYVTAVFAFILTKNWFLRHENFRSSPRFAHAITRIGSLTFGIYLMDPILRKLLLTRFDEALDPHMLSILVSLLWCCASMLLCGLLTFLMKKLPGVRKIL